MCDVFEIDIGNSSKLDQHFTEKRVWNPERTLSCKFERKETSSSVLLRQPNGGPLICNFKHDLQND